jgi:hypothetical protein
MKVFLAFLAVALLILPASSSAFTWTYYDFGSNDFDEHNNSADISYPGHGFVPSPGLDDEGGELYDIEGLNFAYDNDSIFITVTNSFGLGINSTYWGQYFASGDLFFGFDGAYDQFAISFDDGNLYSVDSWDYITDKPGTYYNNLAIRFGVGAYKINSGSLLSGTDGILSLYRAYETNPMYAYQTDTYLFEFRFAASALGVDINDYSQINFHQTEECGNDLLEKSYDLGVVPEPGTILLLGLGLLGVGAGLRRKK